MTNIPYDLEPNEGGVWDIAVGADGTALLTTLRDSAYGTEWMPVRELTGGTITKRPDAPGSGTGGAVHVETLISRSADRGTFLFSEPGLSPVFTYVAATDGFPSQRILNDSFTSSLTAVNRTGTLFAVERYPDLLILDSNLQTERNGVGTRVLEDGRAVNEVVRAVEPVRAARAVAQPAGRNGCSSTHSATR